ncbi:phosphatidate cytidylyltransferase [Endozoicomonas sp. (ex Bugula neritina AB1)]|nr:phosphatidate cytidylyltransferase [Endozoicomonas sp. (ex Bugula neritina AB1)]
MLKQRIFTAVVLAPLALAGVFLLPAVEFSIFIGLIIMLGGWEWANLSGFERPAARVGFALLVGASCWMVNVLPSIWVLSVAVLWWLAAFWLVKGYPDSARFCENRFVRLLMGLLTLVPAWFALVQLKSMEQGGWLIFMVLITVWAADCGAYFAGRAFGKIKLAKNVSPKKTLEGGVGGVLLAVLISAGIALWNDFSFARGLGLLLLTVLTTLVSILGDLWESMLKRERGIKDSSDLLPGHGGILDRIDSLTAATPVFTLALIAGLGLATGGG